LTIYNHTPRTVGVDVQRRINALQIGQKMQDLPEELWHKSFRFYVKEDPTRKGGPNLRIIRLDPEQPSLTVTGYIFNKFVHPYENRFITPREAARLQGFPDNLEFQGTLTSVQRQIGDAVPIELGKAVFKNLLNTLHKQYPTQQTFQALSLFSGSGGFDIAVKQANETGKATLNTFAGVEIEHDRCETLKHYFGEKLQVFETDITQINSDTILNNCHLNRSNVSVIYGGPPCQSFSQAGKQKGTRDPRGELIFEFLRFVQEIRPPYFVMENVANLKGIDNGRLLQEILSEMDGLGYGVTHRVLNAAYYGSAQKRQRLIFLGSRKELPIQASLPEPTHGESQGFFQLLPLKTVGDAFAGLPSPDYEPIEVPPHPTH
jgi:DNA (cytosine-5)-methyltransferase 1